jgi:hypothetical protein
MLAPLPAKMTPSCGEILQPQPAPWLYWVRRMGSLMGKSWLVGGMPILAAIAAPGWAHAPEWAASQSRQAFQHPAQRITCRPRSSVTSSPPSYQSHCEHHAPGEQAPDVGTDLQRVRQALEHHIAAGGAGNPGAARRPARTHTPRCSRGGSGRIMKDLVPRHL